MADFSNDEDNLFDDSTHSYENETHTLDIVMQECFKNMLKEVHTSLPGKITKIESPQFVSVQPLLQRRYQDGNVVNLPIIQMVPVIMLSGSDYSIQLPIQVGDTGALFFTERSLDNWILNGGLNDPEDPRTHDLSDAFFLPGLNAEPQALKNSTTDLIIKNGSSTLKVQKGGTYQIKNEANELIDLVSQLIEALEQAYVTTLMGPQQFTAPTLQLLTQLKSKVDTLKGS